MTIVNQDQLSGKGMEDLAVYLALRWQSEAKANFSNVKVGAAIIANNGQMRRVFGASNVEISKQENIHAERLALFNAWSEGYTNIEAVYVSSQSKQERAALCMNCRGLFLKLNNLKLKVIVINPDKSIKMRKVLRDLCPLAYI